MLSLLLQVVEISLLTTYPPVEEGCDEFTNTVDESRNTNETGIMIKRPVLRPEDKNDNEGVQKVCEGCVKGPEGFDSATATAAGVEGEIRSRDLRC